MVFFVAMNVKKYSSDSRYVLITWWVGIVFYVDGKVMAVSASISQSKTSVKIEELVRAIEYSDIPAFNISYNAECREQVVGTVLSGYFWGVQQLMDFFADNYDYSEHLQVFWMACQDIGLERSPYGPVCLDAAGLNYLSFAESMNVLVARIRQLTRQPLYRRKEADRKYQATQNAINLEDYTRAVLDKYSRTVVVRVDFHYLDIVDRFLRIDHLYSDLSALLKARERHSIFEHEIGYAWSIEQGEDKGFHVHAAFFFNGAHVRSDWNKAREIGELWQQVTGGRGYCFRCNDDKEKYTDLGIGTIKRADTVACNNVVKAMSYLAKESQHLRIKPARMRSFGMGQISSARTDSPR